MSLPLLPVDVVGGVACGCWWCGVVVVAAVVAVASGEEEKQHEENKIIFIYLYIDIFTLAIEDWRKQTKNKLTN